MSEVLDQIATGVAFMGMLLIVVGFAFAMSISVRLTLAQPDFWQGQFGSFNERMRFRSRVGVLAREKEETSRSGRIADWFLRRGTVLLIVGGISKVTLFFIERHGV